MNELDLKELIKKTGLGRKGFAKKLNISLDTLNSWQYKGANIPPAKEEYIKLVFSTYFEEKKNKGQLDTLVKEMIQEELTPIQDQLEGLKEAAKATNKQMMQIDYILREVAELKKKSSSKGS